MSSSVKFIMSDFKTAAGSKDANPGMSINVYGQPPEKTGVALMGGERKHYLGCVADNFYNDDWSCNKGTEGGDWGYNKMWATSEGKPTWMRLQFAGLVEIYMFSFLNRENDEDKAKKMTVHHEGGSEEFSIDSVNSANGYHFNKPITTSWMKIELTEFHGTNRAFGGSVQVFGVLPKDMQKMEIL